MVKKLLLFLSIATATITTAQQSSNVSSFTANFNQLSSCMSVYSVLNSNSKPLNYHGPLNAVSFIQRKSPTFIASPSGESNSGTIVAYIGANMASQWDSTVVYTSSTNLARFPQGGLYFSPLNPNLQNAYVVACGPAMNGTNWTGNWYASKSLTTTAIKNSAGADIQFFSNTGTFSTSTSPGMVKHDMARNSFHASLNARLWSAGELYDDVNATTPVSRNFRGSMVSEGVFNSGTIVWTPDTFSAPCILRTDGSKQVYPKCWMAFNENGTVGYLMMIGSRTGQTMANRGWQPIIYKTTNTGSTWNLVNGIDFNSGNFNTLLSSLAPVNTNNTLTIPYFNVQEGLDMIVDKNDKLHIFTSLASTSSSHQDSLDIPHTYTVNGNPNLNYKFSPGKMPYLVDFIGDGATGWTYKIIDSVGTQARLGVIPSFTTFPWSGNPGPGVQGSEMRLQMSCPVGSYGEDFILYSWTESDTSANPNNYKINDHPNIKTRALRIIDNSLSATKYSITNPSSGFNARVKDKAYFYYVSPKFKKMCLSSSLVSFTVPYTVSNNVLTDPEVPIDNFYANAIMQFSFAPIANGCLMSVNEPTKNTIEFNIFPNPASQQIDIKLSIENKKDVSICLINALGQTLLMHHISGNNGENTIPLNLGNISPGIYFIKIKSGTDESVKKLIVE